MPNAFIFHKAQDTVVWSCNCTYGACEKKKLQDRLTKWKDACSLTVSSCRGSQWDSSETWQCDTCCGDETNTGTISKKSVFTFSGEGGGKFWGTNL